MTKILYDGSPVNTSVNEIVIDDETSICIDRFGYVVLLGDDGDSETTLASDFDTLERIYKALGQAIEHGWLFKPKLVEGDTDE